jgi:hypothetical protein
VWQQAGQGRAAGEARGGNYSSSRAMTQASKKGWEIAAAAESDGRVIPRLPLVAPRILIISRPLPLRPHCGWKSGTVFHPRKGTRPLQYLKAGGHMTPLPMLRVHLLSVFEEPDIMLLQGQRTTHLTCFALLCLIDSPTLTRFILQWPHI